MSNGNKQRSIVRILALVMAVVMALGLIVGALQLLL